VAAELAALNPDVILAGNSDAIRAIQHVSSTIPIVFPAMQDPVANGLVASLARPGGNVTGLNITAGLEAAKRLELLKEVMPGMSRVAILWDRHSAVRYRETAVAAQTLGVGYLSLEFQDTSDLDAILASAGTGGVDGLIVTGSFQISALEQRIVDIAMRDRVPAMYSIVTAVPRGGLLAYAPSILENYRRAATYVDKILKGAKPADLPVELPTEFELVVNLKTANALGLTIPQSVLQHATEVIQ
jgi:putative tryptophan/tyrosine transport system substrate-binding protein